MTISGNVTNNIWLKLAWLLIKIKTRVDTIVLSCYRAIVPIYIILVVKISVPGVFIAQNGDYQASIGYGKVLG